MTFLDLVRSRSSVRAYKPDPVPQSILNHVLEAGRLAPAALTGDATFLRVDLFATTNAVRGTTNSFLITTTSVADPSKQDAVQATVIAR